jgi:hypothetical protein
MKKKCYEEGGLTFAEMSDEDRAAAAREAIEAINARQRPAEVEVEEKVETVKKRPSKPAVKKEAAVKVESKPELKVETKAAPERKGFYPEMPKPKAAESAKAAMPDVAARKAATESRQRRSVFGGENKGVYGMKAGGTVSSASKRADGCAQRGKTRGKMV